MNRVLHRRTARAVWSVLERGSGGDREQAVAAYVRLLMKAASHAAGLPVQEWAMREQVLPEQSLALDHTCQNEASLLLEAISKEEWLRQDELAGWMYQYMLEERKNDLFAAFKQGNKAREKDIPAVTQLFTPRWITRYMAENTVGRLWTEAFPGRDFGAQWRYYDRTCPEAAYGIRETVEQGNAPQGNNIALQGRPAVPEAWRVMDPACGCGHVLIAAFDVLADIYTWLGYEPAQAARLLISRNLYGLDVDPLAVRLCRFVLLLKAAALDPGILTESLQLGIEDFSSTPELSFGSLERPSCSGTGVGEDTGMPGSALEPSPDRQFNQACPLPSGRARLLLGMRYDVVIANPPYMSRRNMEDRLALFLDKEYPRSRNDLFAAFLEQGVALTCEGGYHAAINQQAWMFLGGYGELRSSLLGQTCLITLLHLGTRTFEEIGGEVVQSVCFVLRKVKPNKRTAAVFWRLTEEPAPAAKERAYLEGGRSSKNRYSVYQQDFYNLPGFRIAYELPDSWLRMFRELPPLSSRYAVKKGMDTGCNERFIRYWHEVEPSSISRLLPDISPGSWYPYAKGGGNRKWYGYDHYVVYWANAGEAIRRDSRSNLRNEAYFGRPGITWSTVSTGRPGFRLLEEGFLFDNGGSCLFPLSSSDQSRYGLLAYLNSRFVWELLRQLNPTLNIQPGDVAKLPLDHDLLDDPELNRLGRECLVLAKREWSLLERSWAYAGHPAAEGGRDEPIGDRIRRKVEERQEGAVRLARLEQEIDNLIYARFGLEPLSSAETPDPAKAGLADETAAFLSAAFGAMMDVYPTGGSRPFASSSPVLCDRELLPRLRHWLGLAGEPEAVERNLEWLGEALGMRKGETPARRLLRYWSREWYREHRRKMDGSPLYLRLSSGPLNAYLGFVPVRRMTLQTVGAVREQIQQRLREAEGDVLKSGTLEYMPTVPGGPIVEELRRYLERLCHFLDRAADGEAAQYWEAQSAVCSRTIRERFAPLL